MHERMLEHAPLCDKIVRCSAPECAQYEQLSTLWCAPQSTPQRTLCATVPCAAPPPQVEARSANCCSILATIVARGVMSAPLTSFASSQCGRGGLDGKL